MTSQKRRGVMWALAVKNTAEGKVLDVNVFGAIDGDWLDDEGTETAAIAKQLQENKDATQIKVHINSVGGSLYGAIAVRNALEAHPAPVTCYIEGLAASAASVIAMAGRTVMCRGSTMFVHRPMTLTFGNVDDHLAQIKALDVAGDNLIGIYLDKVRSRTSRAELVALLIAETWMSAEKALQLGFADEVAGAPVAVANVAGDAIVNGVRFPQRYAKGIARAAAAPRMTGPEMMAWATRQVDRERVRSENAERARAWLAERNLPRIV